MKTFRYFIFPGILLLAFAACTKDFSALNSNPNTSEKVLAQNLLSRALVESVKNNMNRNRTITNELMQVTVNTLVETDRIFRYDIRRNIAEAPWNGWYIQLSNFRDMYKFASENTSDENSSKVYMAISLICQAWLHSIITDTYGDSPYSEANKAKEGIYAPVFDRQKDIYADLFKKLEEANDLLKGARNVAAVHDPVYRGDVLLWRKFGNSLYLRLLLRVSGKAETATEAIARIKHMADENPAGYPIIGNNAESAILRWTGVNPFNSAFSDMRDAEWRYPRACSFLVDKLDRTADPCLSRWITLSEGLYEGIPSGYTYGQTPEPKSYLQESLRTDPLTGNILNYAEVQLILAEAAAKGWISGGPAKLYYENAVTARITLWGRTVGNYMAGPEIAWNESDPLAEKMQKIHWQKYLALFGTDMQAWIEHRRTGYPILPKGQGLRNDGIMPTRLFYPISVQATNSKHYQDAIAAQGPDDLKSLVWWQKPEL